MSEEVLRRLNAEGLKLGSLYKRVFAFFLDEVIVSILFYFIYANNFNSATTVDMMVRLVNMLFLQVILLKVIYHTFFVWMYGATPGKMLLKIKIILIEDFDKPNLTSAFVRAAIRIVSEMLFYLGFLWVLFNPLRQAWHDKAAKTMVIDV